MTIDAVAERAARELRASAAGSDVLAIEAGLADLCRRSSRRTTGRVVGLAVTGVVAAAAVWAGSPPGAGPDRVQPLPAADFPPLGGLFDVIAVDDAPSGETQVVATRRDGQPSVVVVRTRRTPALDVVWSAPTSHELGDREVPFPAAVAWAPDESAIAIVVAQPRGRREERTGLIDLQLVTVAPDGSGRRLVGAIGTCRCTDALPTMEWAGRIVVAVPDGPDRGPWARRVP